MSSICTAWPVFARGMIAPFGSGRPPPWGRTSSTNCSPSSDFGRTTARVPCGMTIPGSMDIVTSVPPPPAPAIERTLPTWTPETRTSSSGTSPLADVKSAFNW